jgi:hypothetical protein
MEEHSQSKSPKDAQTVHALPGGCGRPRLRLSAEAQQRKFTVGFWVLGTADLLLWLHPPGKVAGGLFNNWICSARAGSEELKRSLLRRR